MKKVIFLVVCLLMVAVQVFAMDYVIGEGDTLQISVWGSPELSMGVVVRPDGKISLPALGEIKASGLMPTQLKVLLEEKLESVVKNPIVTVIVTGML
ncbi:MAG: polysaccharide biosynthesis/export family protein, partial [Nitrospirota bacterium]